MKLSRVLEQQTCACGESSLTTVLLIHIRRTIHSPLLMPVFEGTTYTVDSSL